MATKQSVKAPSHLRSDTARWYKAVLSDFVLEEHHRRLLLLAAESFDRCRQAREALAEHGTTFEDRFGQPRTRPEVAIERDAKLSFARLVRELALDIDLPSEPYSRSPIIQGKADRRL